MYYVAIYSSYINTLVSVKLFYLKANNIYLTTSNTNLCCFYQRRKAKIFLIVCEEKYTYIALYIDFQNNSSMETFEVYCNILLNNMS